MNKFINKIYIKALVGANMAKNELQKMREEDEGLDIIITIISQVNQIGNTVGGLNSTVK